MPRDYRLYLGDILDAIGKIEIYTSDSSFENFIQNGMLVDAVLFNLEIIGEAAGRISQELRFNIGGVEAQQVFGVQAFIRDPSVDEQHDGVLRHLQDAGLGLRVSDVVAVLAAIGAVLLGRSRSRSRGGLGHHFPDPQQRGGAGHHHGPSRLRAD